MQWYSRELCNDSCFAGLIVIKMSTNTKDLLGCMEACDFYMHETTCKVPSILMCFVASSCMIISTFTNESKSNMNIWNYLNFTTHSPLIRTLVCSWAFLWVNPPLDTPAACQTFSCIKIKMVCSKQCHGSYLLIFLVRKVCGVFNCIMGIKP